METQQVTGHIIKDGDDGVHLTAACYTVGDYRYGYEDMSCITPVHNMVQWWAFVVSDEPAVIISYTIEL